MACGNGITRQKIRGEDRRQQRQNVEGLKQNIEVLTENMGERVKRDYTKGGNGDLLRLNTHP